MENINIEGIIALPAIVSAQGPFIPNINNPVCNHIIKNINTGIYFIVNIPSL